MDREGLQYIGCLVLLSVIGLGVSLLVLTALYVGLTLPACNNLANLNPDYEFTFILPNGCLVKAPNGRWIPVSDFPYIQGELELKDGTGE